MSVRATTTGAVATAALLGIGAASALGATSGSGSTFARVAYTNWCQDTGNCSYTGVGSGAGLSALGSKVVDFAGSDAVPTPDQISKIQSADGGAGPLYFPTLLGAISVPVNVSGVSGHLKLDGPTLGGIFDGDITSWNDRAIAKLNPGAKLPSAPITVCVRSDASGTSFGFSRYLTKVSPSFKSKVNFSQTPPWSAPNVQKGAGNPGVANCIKTNSNSVGYVDLSDATNAGLAPQIATIGKSQVTEVKTKKNGKTVTSTVRKTVFVLPSPKTISAAGNMKTFPANFLLDPSASPAPAAYPIVITTWVVTYGNYGPTGRDLAGVRSFLNYAYSPAAQNNLVSLGYAPLPANLAKAAKAQIAKLK